MSNRIKHLFFRYFKILISISILYIILIKVLNNGNTMYITMHSGGKQLNAELYYTKIGETFGEDRIKYIEKVKGDRYAFKLPDFNEMNFVRFDPSKSKQKICIDKDIIIVASSWFNKRFFKADITKSEPVMQIKNYKINTSGICFETTGKDPQLGINLTKTYIYTTKDYHIDTLIYAVILYLIILFLYNIYKKVPLDEKLIAKLILYSFFLGLSIFKVNYYKENVNPKDIPDFIAHLSYVDTIHKEHPILPKFEDMYMVTNKNAGNYLGHPPLYYYLMDLTYDNKLSLSGNIPKFQSLNVAIFIFGFILMLYIGYNLRLSILGDLVYLTTIFSLPMHAYLGSSLTNDNLAIVGGVVFLVGLQKILSKKDFNTGYLWISIGFFVAFFSKLTAALLIFFAMLYLSVYMIKTKDRFNLNRKHIVIFSLFLIPIIFYQSYIFLQYHSLTATLNITHPKEYLHSVYYIPEDKRVYKTPIEWLKIYWHFIHSGWFGIHSFHSFYKHTIMGYIGLFVFHIFAILSLFSFCNKKSKSECLLGRIALLSLITVAIVQLIFSYNAHLHSGYLGGLQTRYLLPFMSSFAIMAAIYVERYKNNFLFIILIILLSIQAIYADIFYFIKYFY